MKKILTYALALATAATVLTALAHDAWVSPLGGPVYPILYGHKVPEAYPTGKVTSIKVFDAGQKPLAFQRTAGKGGLSIRPTGQPALFALEFDNGFWVKVGTEKESRNVRKSALPAGTVGGQSSHPLKFSKTLLRWAAWMARPLGQRIELVPVAVAATALPAAGSALKLRLLLDGKPLAGQMVENNSNETGPKTDANGYVTVTVLKGINRFATDHDIAQPTQPDAQRLSLTAALVFVAR